MPGQQVTFTVTIADTGQTPYTGAVVTDSLAGILNDAAYNNDAAATGGAVSYASPVLTWTGNLAPGASRRHHLFRHGRKPRQRRQDPDHHRGLHRGRAPAARRAAATPAARSPSPC